MNQDEGQYQLCNVFDDLLKKSSLQELHTEDCHFTIGVDVMMTRVIES